MTKQKKGLIIAAIIVLVLSTPIIAWWSYIAYWGKEKHVDYTYNMVDLVKADGSKEQIVKIRYYQNEDNSGLEMFEVDLSSFLDEKRVNVKSQGLQFVATDAETPLEWAMIWPKGYKDRKTIGKENWYWKVTKPLKKKRYYASFGSWGLKSGETFNYASTNGYQTTIDDNNPLNANSGFKISLQNDDNTSDIYKMQFKGKYFEVCDEKFPYGRQNNMKKENSYPSEADHRKEEKNFIKRYRDGLHGDYTDYIDTFYTYDPYWFAYELYNSVQTIAAGTEETFIFSWGDFFDYKKYNPETGVYQTVEGNEWTKVYNYVTSNIAVKIEVIERGAQRASDSLFNVVKGSPTFNLTGDKNNGDYFYGNSIVNLDVAEFDLVQVAGNQYCLKMSDNAYNHYSKFKEDVQLSICIDLDILNKKNYVFAGFTSDSRLSEFDIYDCYTIETKDGQVVRTEVEYGAVA